MRYLTQWFKRYFSDPEVVFLTIFLLVFFAVVLTMGDMLAPVLASLVIAYLLEGLVGMLERKRIPRFIAVLVVYLGFLLFVTLFLFVVMPQLSIQLTQLFQQIPAMITEGQKLLMQLPEHYPDFISPQEVQEIIGVIRQEIAEFGQTVLSVSFASVVGVITVLVYLILMPLLVFFFLKDKNLILRYLLGFFPRDRRLAGDHHCLGRQLFHIQRPGTAIRGVARSFGGSVCHYSLHWCRGCHISGDSDRMVSMGLG